MDTYKPELILKSEKADLVTKLWATIATATFNRQSELIRLYNSIVRIADITKGDIQFEWLIIDDGSSDSTTQTVSDWCAENLIPIRYYKQPNQGKHVAINHATELARGEIMVTIDSDDELLPDSLNTFYDTWTSIPVDIKQGLKGVTGRCIDPQTGKIIGTPIPKKYNDGKYLITSPQDLRHKYRLKGEMCGFNRTDILRKYPHLVKADSGRFMPESILWYTIGKEYQEYVIDLPVRVYHSDGNGAITAGGSRNRAPQNYYLWQFMVNNILKQYIFSDPKNMLKAVVGISMDGFRTGRSVSTILADCKGVFAKCMVLGFMPCGWLLSKR